MKRNGLAARSATLSAFERRCIPSPPQRGCQVGDPGPGGVAPPSHTPGMLGRRALPGGRIAALGATMDLHHGLLALMLPFGFAVLLGARPSNAEWTPGQCGSRVGVERGCIARRMQPDFHHGLLDPVSIGPQVEP